MTHSVDFDASQDWDDDTYEALADLIGDALVDTVGVRATLRGHMIASRLLNAGWSVIPPGTGGCVCPPGSPLHFDACPIPPDKP